MGTLTSCRFMPLNSEFRFNPVRRAFRERIQCHKLNRLRSPSRFFAHTDISKWGKRKKHSLNFDRFRSFASNNNDKEAIDDERESDDNNNDPKSNVTTELFEEEIIPSFDNQAFLSELRYNFAVLATDSFGLMPDDRFLLLFLGYVVDPSDVNLILDKLFGYSTFWVTRVESYGRQQEGVIFFGNLRGEREDVFNKLQKQLVEVTGDKYNLFMMEDPSSDIPDPQDLFADAMLFINQNYLLHPAASGAMEDPLLVQIFPFLVSRSPSPSTSVIVLGILGVILFHEVGHILVAFPKQIKLTVPYFIPDAYVGSIITINQFIPILPDRSTKVDISLAGPFAGAVLSFFMFAIGLLLSSDPDATRDLVEVPSSLFQASLLLGLISRATLGYKEMHSATVSIHPLVIAGWCGLTSQAFNMLPVGAP
ncbi:hypothetical protein SESBI_23008 [Sesbania bispinosa]|nr:hypothetical protein SESBI_23008 [Sesbania bispinosa]